MGTRGLKAAIVGTGFGVKTQLPAFRAAGGWEVVSLTGRDADKTARLASAHGVPHALGDITESVSVGDPDVVCVSTPPALHLAQTRAVLKAGRHCLLEKPMALDANEAAALVALAHDHPDQLTLIDHELRFLPNPRALRRRLAAGDIGEPLFVRVTFTSHGRGRPGTTWNWWSRLADGGGLWGAIGSHVVDMLRWWLGEVSMVGARLTTSVDRLPDGDGVVREVDADDGADVRLRFASGVAGSISLTSVAHHYEGIRWEVHGRDGSLWIESDGSLHGASREEADRHDLSESDELGRGPILDGSLWARGFCILAGELREALVRDEGERLDPAARFDDGHRVQMVLDAARHSHATAGRDVRL
jgi:predicted dehydrogenase